MVIKLYTEEDFDKYKKIFYAINKKMDGLLTRHELLESYWQVGFTSMSQVELDRTLAVVDSD